MTALVYLWVFLVVFCFVVFYFRKHIRWTYESILLWRAINRAQDELRKIGQGKIADEIKWDEKWYGRKDD
jgi:hypothetical protein